MPRYEVTVGLEVHVQLLTHSKIFCRCTNQFGGEPNSRICPICLGYPGTLPVLNRAVVDQAIRLALALGCTVQPHSVFARKNYFYADLPKGYQISQFDEPIATGGRIPIDDSRSIAIHRLHLEEDAGKLLHETPGGGALPGKSLVDFNRCGVPLVEIVSEPDMSSAKEAHDYLQALHQVLDYTATSDGNMEEGSLRCDANVSIRPVGQTELGTKVEVKNLNSFRNVARAIEHEIDRQALIVDAGDEVLAETRSFEASTGVTRLLRGKEESHDYRYFPEPDLPPLVLEEARIEAARSGLPELPWDRRRRFRDTYGLPDADAELLSSTRRLADYYESAVAAHGQDPKIVANWVMTEVLRELKERHIDVDSAISPERLASLIALIEDGSLSHRAAKDVFGEMWECDEPANVLVERLGLSQVRDDDALVGWVETVVAAHPAPVEQYRAGEQKVVGFLVGQIMKESQGRADPKRVRELLVETLS